jgi:hypothetical protein
MTPVLYGVHALINRYLGMPLAKRMMQAAEASESMP